MRIKINKTDCLLAILFFFQLKPESIDFLSSGLDMMWNICRLAATAVCILLYLKKYKKVFHNKALRSLFICLCLYCLSQFVSSLINNISIRPSILSSAYLISMFIVLSLMLENGIDSFLKICICVYGFFILLNAVTLILYYPQGMYVTMLDGMVRTTSNYFLGTKNEFYLYILPFVMCTLVYLHRDQGHRSHVGLYFIIACGYISVIIVWSATSIFLLVIMLVALLFPKLLGYTKLFHIKNYIYAVAAVFVLIVLLDGISMFSWLIVGILNKNLTLTGRTQIWIKILTYIAQSPIFGYGTLSGEEIVSMTGHVQYINAHNMYLWTMFCGGLLSLIPFLGIIFYPAKNLWKYKNKKSAQFISWAALNVLLSWIVEVNSLRCVLVVFVLGCSMELTGKQGGFHETHTNSI